MNLWMWRRTTLFPSYAHLLWKSNISTFMIKYFQKHPLMYVGKDCIPLNIKKYHSLFLFPIRKFHVLFFFSNIIPNSLLLSLVLNSSSFWHPKIKWHLILLYKYIYIFPEEFNEDYWIRKRGRYTCSYRKGGGDYCHTWKRGQVTASHAEYWPIREGLSTDQSERICHHLLHWKKVHAIWQRLNMTMLMRMIIWSDYRLFQRLYT